MSYFSSAAPQLLNEASLQNKFDFALYDNINHIDKEVILFFDSDVRIEQDLNAEYILALVKALGGDESSSILMMVNGNLDVRGTVKPGNDGIPSLLVIGNLTCDVLQNYDESIYVAGDANVKYVYDGNYNHGSITVKGKLNVPYLLNSDHHSDVNPQGAILINYYSNHNDFFTYDYTTNDFERVMVPGVLDDRGDFSQHRFIQWVKEGKNPLKDDAKSLKVLYAQALDQKVVEEGDTLTTLDLTDQKFTAFPMQILTLKKLTKLVLNKNKISVIADEIGLMESLEELHLSDCGIEKLPNGIGNLKNLRVLNVSQNYRLATLPDSIGDLVQLKMLNVDYVPIQFGEAMSKLENLEELKMYNCYRDRDHVAKFPEVVTRLTNLKKLDLRENIIEELYPSLVNLENLEEFLWKGSRTQSASFPDFTQFKKLKKLIISSKFTTWKDVVFKLTSLEHLELDRNAEEKQYFTEDMLEEWQSMAKEHPDEFGYLQEMIDRKVREADGRFSVVSRPGINVNDLAGIGALQKLTYLDLSFNGLPYLPEEFYQLKALKTINLYSNKLSESEKEKIKNTYPNAEIKF
ncbi:leucine-rich repeat domain-containing protein [Pseudochryseolinea flava]|uniref:Disease resistance R13L4/SHOC-2-like LRR domain-containing protein n=1 Tax=Pseudochryseolinea flava TaxID=2059302 RepID=A0A364XVQ9_9BACT|nr:leucine-rich repeat domain-containing protein [Pseudochryseolinea flava]RAV97589.1 hypothetical protein DQQ10_27630 [Pseudochryseolinea flava]